MADQEKIAVVGVDWGTTHRRAYGLTADGVCVQEYADAEGSLACKGRFGPALQALLAAMQASPELVLMSGMVGSALGWQQVPYVDADVPLASLGQHLVTVPDGPDGSIGSACAIVPGYCVRDAQGQPDVMRGEETQLLGAVVSGQASGWFVLPGTHSKWVELQHGRVVQLRTYMTGELFSLLTQHGTLAAATAPGDDPAWDGAAFAQGVQASRHGGLTHQLFGCRARVVCGDMAASHAKAYLSGLLIGSEFQDALHRTAPNVGQGAAPAQQPLPTLQVLGSPALARHYLDAAASFGVALTVMDPAPAYIGAVNALYRAWRQGQGT